MVRQRGIDSVTGVDPSFDVSFRRLYQLAYRVAYRLLGDRGEAEDVAQEAMARALVRWARLADQPEGWVTRVASNLAIDRCRRRARLEERLRGPLGIAEPHRAERVDLVRALAQLPRRQREVVVLRYLADLGESEVALTLGCSVGTVKSHGHRGLAAMRRHLGTIPEEQGDVRAS